MKAFGLLALGVSLLTAQVNTLTPKEEPEGWILLFDGDSLFGWTAAGDARWRAADGTIVADSGGSGWLRSNAAFADYVLKCDFRAARARKVVSRAAPHVQSATCGFVTG